MRNWLLNKISVRGIAVAFILMGGVTSTIAQEERALPQRITTKSDMIGYGQASLLDTYLSAETYTGYRIDYLSHIMRTKEESRWMQLKIHQGNFTYAKNRAKNAYEMEGMYQFEYGVFYQWQLFEKHLQLMTGGKMNLHAGALYNGRNGNNPMQAKLGVNIAPALILSYALKIQKVPLQLRYELSTPIVGMMFSPNYGQSYYEIFSRGDYDHNIVCTYLGNAPALKQLLTLDFTLWKTTFRVGYLGDYQQANVNNLKYHSYSNSLVIGLVKKFTLTHILP